MRRRTRLRDREQHGRQAEADDRRDRDADGDDRAEVERLVGRGPAAAPARRVRGGAHERHQRWTAGAARAARPASTTAAIAIRQALMVSTDIGTTSRMTWTPRPPVPQRTPARQICSRPRPARGGSRAQPVHPPIRRVSAGGRGGDLGRQRRGVGGAVGVVGVGHRDRRHRVLVVVGDGDRHARQPGRDLAVLDGVPPLPGVGQQPPQRAQRARAVTVAVDEVRRLRVERAHLGRRQLREDRPAAGRQLRRQPDADVGDQRRPAGRPLLDDVEHLATVQHGQVRRLADAVHQGGERPAGQALQGFLARVAAAELERRQPEAVAVLVGEVDDEAFLDHRVEQVVRRAPRQLAGAHDPVERRPGRAGRPGTAAPASRGSLRAPGSCPKATAQSAWSSRCGHPALPGR